MNAFIFFTVCLALARALHSQEFRGYRDEINLDVVDHVYCATKLIGPSHVKAYEACSQARKLAQIMVKCKQTIIPNDMDRREIECKRISLAESTSQKLENCIEKEKQANCSDCTEHYNTLRYATLNCRQKVLESIAELEFNKTIEKFWTDHEIKLDKIAKDEMKFCNDSKELTETQIMKGKLCNVYKGKIDEKVLKKCSEETWQIAQVVNGNDITMLMVYSRFFRLRDVRRKIACSRMGRNIIDASVKMCLLDNLIGEPLKGVNYVPTRSLWITQNDKEMHPFDVIDERTNVEVLWTSCLAKAVD